MIQKDEMQSRMKNNAFISLTELNREITRQQSDASQMLKQVNFISDERVIIPLEEVSVLKLFACSFKNCDFMNAALDNGSDPSQRTLESNVFENCSFTSCKGIHSFNECVFIGCSFADCDFRSTTFISCLFIDSSAGSTDFRMANFSLANYRDLYLENGCRTEGSLLLMGEDPAEKTDEPAEKAEKEMEIAMHLLETAVRLIYDAMRYASDDQMHLDPIASNLSLFIQEKEKLLEHDQLREVDQDQIVQDIVRHEEWAGMIVNNGMPMPDTDWTSCSIRSFDFSGHNLSHIDFSGSSLKGCDFSECNLTGADFSGCNLTGVNFAKAVFAGNCFDNAKLENITIDRRNLEAFQKAGILINTSGTVPLKGFKSADGRKRKI